MAIHESSLTIERSGGVEPNSFPHQCVYQPKGATVEFCREVTANFQRNKDGCYRMKCNCELRKCIMCLSLGRHGKELKYVSDLETGLCNDHAEEVKGRKTSQATASKPVDRSPERIKKSLDPTQASPEVPHVPAPPTGDPDPDVPREVAAPAPERSGVVQQDTLDEEQVLRRGVEGVLQLKGRNLRLFQHCGRGLDNVEIAELESTTSGTIGVYMAGVYRALGIHDVPRGKKRKMAMAIYQRYIAKV